MKKILITGANSYIGTSFEKYINENYPESYTVDTVDMIDGSWKSKSFPDTMRSCIWPDWRIPIRKRTKKRFTTPSTAIWRLRWPEKPKADGCRQFIFMSSVLVYGSHHTLIKKKRRWSRIIFMVTARNKRKRESLPWRIQTSMSPLCARL